MAGVRTNKDGAAYGLKGLFSAGEAACWDMHGFNRLGGNSLAETIVAGKIVGEKIAEFLKGYEVNFNTAVIKDAVAKDYERLSPAYELRRKLLSDRRLTLQEFYPGWNSWQ